MMCHRLSCQNCNCGEEHKICRIAGQHTQAELQLLQSKPYRGLDFIKERMMSKIDCLGCGRLVEEGLTPDYCNDCIDGSGDGPAAKIEEI